MVQIALTVFFQFYEDAMVTAWRAKVGMDEDLVVGLGVGQVRRNVDTGRFRYLRLWLVSR